MTQDGFKGAPDRIELSSRIVAAYVSNNPVPTSDLPALIAQMHLAVSGLTSGDGAGYATTDAQIEKPTPAQIRKSVRPDGIVSFVDGKSYKTLKRHLSASGLNPRSYRERYGLPADYPMVAAEYAERRSALAKAIGLGQPGARRSAQGRKAGLIGG